MRFFSVVLLVSQSLFSAGLAQPTYVPRSESDDNMSPAYREIPYSHAREGFWDRSEISSCGSSPFDHTQFFASQSIFMDYQAQIGKRGIDAPDLHRVGVNPANLVPEGLDLDFFPVFEVSDQLQIKPSLFYQVDPFTEGRGDLSYATPKRWWFHYGELTRYISDTRYQKRPFSVDAAPLNQPVPTSSYHTEYIDQNTYTPVATEVDTVFVDRNGQVFNFYPDPDGFQPNDLHIPKQNSQLNPEIKVWFAKEGNVRLVREGNQFKIHAPAGIVYVLEAYEKHHGIQNPGDMEAEENREYLSVHYRVSRVEDAYGNYVSVSYAAGLHPSTVRAYSKDQSGDRLLFQFQYGYDARGRLRSLTLPRNNNSAVAAATTDYRFYYPDSLDSQALATGVLKESAVHWLDDQQTVAEAVALAGRARFESVDAGWVTYNGSGRIDCDLSQIPANLREVLVWPQTATGREANLGKATFYLALEPAQGSPVYYRLGTHEFSPQMKYTDRVHQGPVVIPRHHRFLETPTAYPDQLRVSKLRLSAGNNQVDLPSGTYRLKLYPIIKNGDLLLKANSSSLSAVKVDEPSLNLLDDGLVFNPESVRVSAHQGSVGSGDRLYHVRREVADRIVQIAYPQDDAGNRLRMNLSYDDHTLEHAEIRKVSVFDDGVNAFGTDGFRLPTRSTTYAYEQVRSLGHSEDLANAALAPDPPCENCDERWIGFTDPDRRLEVTSFAHLETRRDILRRKEVSFLTFNPVSQAWETASHPLVTHYGGAYRFVLAGNSNLYQPGDFDSCGSINACRQTMWSLDGKLFDYTWQIQPDGSALVFDLHPDGLGMDSESEILDRAGKVFKVYRFDSHFQGRIEALFPHTLNFRDVPYFTFAPGYRNNVTLSELRANPEPATISWPTRQALFQFKNDPNGPSKCIHIKVTAQQPVPVFKYNLYRPGDDPGIHRLSERLSAIQTHLQSDNCYTHIYRISAAWLLKDQGLSAFENYFHGAMTTDLDFGGEAQYEVKWQLKGRDKVSPYQRISARRQLLQTMPAWSWEAENRDGFDWNPSESHPTVVSKNILKAERFSNGGFLGHGTGAAHLDRRGIHVTNLPAGIQVGDQAAIQGELYTITAINGQDLSTYPILFGVHQTAPFPVTFYRYADPIWNASAKTLSYTSAYRGWDPFGNNHYKETYTRGLNFRAESGCTLTPDFQTTAPASVEENNGYENTNNDYENFTYLGRPGKKCIRIGKPFYRYTTNGTSGSFVNGANALNYRRFESYQYDADYPWKPTRVRKHLVPHPSTNPVNSSLDEITEIQYIKQNGLGVLNGRPHLNKTYRADDSSSFTAVQYDYDDRGRPSLESTASFAPDHQGQPQAPFGMRSRYTRDRATGLVLKQELFIGEAEFNQGELLVHDGNGVSPTLLQSVNHISYDRQGRETQSYAVDRTGARLGPDKVTRYPHSLLKEELQTNGEAGDLQLLRKQAFTDGLQRPVRVTETLTDHTVYQKPNAGTGATLVSDIVYDQAGRIAYETFPAVEGVLSARKVPVYDERGETVGTLVYNITDQGSLFLETGDWQVSLEDPVGGDAVQFQFHLDHDVDPSLPLQVKRLRMDAFGRVVEVGDLAFTNPISAVTWNENTFFQKGADARIQPKAAWRTLKQALASHMSDYQPDHAVARYDFDAGDQVYRALVGYRDAGGQLVFPQERIFQFDQWGRLRKELHPEMNSQICYAEFDRFNNPTRMLEKSSTAVRDRYSEYDAMGNPLRIQYFSSEQTPGALGQPQEETLYTYEYQLRHQSGYPGNDDAPRFPNLPRLVMNRDREGQSVIEIGYRFQYNPDNSRVLSYELLQNAEPQFPGYVSSINLDTNPAQPIALGLNYDNIGRPTRLRYPTGHLGSPQVNGVAKPTELAFSYSDNGLETGRLTRISDQTQGDLSLISDITYDATGIAAYNLGWAQDGHRIRKSHDALNRISTIETQWSAGSETRNYQFDGRGRIEAIEIFSSEQAPARLSYSYDPLSRIRSAQLDIPEATTPLLYGYDYDVFGNLWERRTPGASQPETQFRADPGTNQIISGTYSPFGELTQISENGQQLTMSYSLRGRMTELQRGNDSAYYLYDPSGYRIFNRQSSGQGTETTMTFYNPEGQALTEWKAEGSEPAQWNQHWFYFNGNTFMTYERDLAELPDPVASPLLNGEGRPLSLAINDRTFQIDNPDFDVDAGYDLLVYEADGDLALSIRQAKGSQMILPLNLKHGLYRFQVQPKSGAAPFQAEMRYGPEPPPEPQTELLGQYTFAAGMTDSSAYGVAATNVGGSAGSESGIPHWSFLYQWHEMTVPTPFTRGEPGSDYSVNLSFKGRPWGKCGILRIDNFELIYIWGTLYYATPTQSAQLLTQAPADTWHDLSLVYQGNQTKVFLNGSQVLEGNWGNKPSGDIILGRSTVDTDYHAFNIRQLEIHKGLVGPAAQ